MDIPFLRHGPSSHLIQVPFIPGAPVGTANDGSNSQLSAGGNAKDPVPQPEKVVDYGTDAYGFYANIPEIAKANGVFPSNQGHLALGQMMAAYMPDAPDQAPARSQKAEGYTAPIQLFASSNTFQIAGQTSVGVRQTQPRTNKFVSPFSSMPIPVRMPWDL
jgi:hypothetical protein